MNLLPSLKRLSDNQKLKLYASTYLKCSGLPIPDSYLNRKGNRIYGIFHKNQMVGGYILGNGDELRTLEVFAQTTDRNRMYREMDSPRNFTEICCFWIAPKYRKHTLLNTYVWLCLAFTLKIHAATSILFGTCSSSLARLYGITPKSVLIHQDFINGKKTFIFHSKRKTCLQGFYEILMHKFRRTAQISQRRTMHAALQTN